MTDLTTAVTRFAEVDRAIDPAHLVRFLDARPSIDGERDVKDLILTLLEPAPGAAILDVGCGTGADTRELADRVGPNGRIVGLDRSAVMIAESRQRAAAAATLSNASPGPELEYVQGDACDLQYVQGDACDLQYVQGDACDLRFADASFDACRAERVLVYVPEPVDAVREMARVVRPGGRVVVSDVDIGTIFVDAADRDTTRRIFSSLADSLPSGWIGRGLPSLFDQAGLRGVRCVPRVIQFNLSFLHLLLDGHLANPDIASQFPPGALSTWWRDLSERDQQTRFHAGTTVFTTIGRTPA